VLSEELREECAGWVSEQLAEENILVDSGLVALILDTEREIGAERVATLATAQAVAESLAARGIQGAPHAIDTPLIYAVLQWEDDFLALAGQPRPD
jgi:hypothetical protein